MKIHQSSMNFLSAKSPRTSPGLHTSSGSDDAKVQQPHATKKTRNKDQANSGNIQAVAKAKSKLRDQTGPLRAAAPIFEKMPSSNLNSAVHHAINAYITEQNRPEQEKLAGLISGFHIAI